MNDGLKIIAIIFHLMFYSIKAITMELYLRWENKDKKRYYEIRFVKDLLNDWCLTKIWGSLYSRQGAMKRVIYNTYTEGLEQIKVSSPNSMVM